MQWPPILTFLLFQKVVQIKFLKKIFTLYIPLATDPGLEGKTLQLDEAL